MRTANTKACTKCGEAKALTIEFFQWRIDRGSWGTICKACIKKQKQEYNKRNSDVIRDKKARYYLKNQKKIKKERKQYYKNNKDKVREYIDRWELNNKEKLKIYRREYRLANKEKLNRQDRDNLRKKKNKNPSIKCYNISRIISHALFKNGGDKNGYSILKYLPFSAEGLKRHLESQFEAWMSWDNYGRYFVEQWHDNDPSTWTWQIDHIIPQSRLPYNSMEHINFQKCWALNNLRPLSSKTNLLKGNK